jgi:hypothetical protein
MISITVISPEGTYIEYSQMPSPSCQYVINLVVILPIWKGSGEFLKVSVPEHGVLHN